MTEAHPQQIEAPFEVRMNPRIFGELRESGVMKTVFTALATVPGIHLARSYDIPEQCISVESRIVGFVDDLDAWDSLSVAGNSVLPAWIAGLTPAIIFKAQWRNGAVYPPGTISAGYFCHPDAYGTVSPDDLLNRDRPIDVTSRMRTGGYNGPPQSWMEERQTIVEEAAALARNGYSAVHGKVAMTEYLRELPDTAVGFHWRGYGRISYRLIEYISAGVVPITQSLGREWPIREDITIEDGITCVVCDNPGNFGAEAKALLKDRAKLARIRKNICELWTECLALPAMGRWYWEQLRRAHLAMPKAASAH